MKDLNELSLLLLLMPQFVCWRLGCVGAGKVVVVAGGGQVRGKG